MKFVERDINDFKNSIRNIFNLMTVEGKYRVIGSSNLKNILYNSDYDLEEQDDYKNVESGTEFLKWKFKDIFNKAEKDSNIFITDFKCGLDSNGEPLRWNKTDIDNGYKISQNGNKKTFEESLTDKDNTIKLDVIALIDGVFVEFSENMYFKFGHGKNAITNYNINDISKNKILQSLKEDYYEKIKEGKYLKALKRKFAYYIYLNDPKYNNVIDGLVNFFNSRVGIVGKSYSDIETLLLIMEKFKRVKMNDIINNLQNIKQNLSYVPELQSMSDIIDKICNMKSKTAISNKLNKLNEKLFKFINKETLKEFKLKHYSKKRI
jgi:hypothetical protein